MVDVRTEIGCPFILSHNEITHDEAEPVRPIAPAFLLNPCRYK